MTPAALVVVSQGGWVIADKPASVPTLSERGFDTSLVEIVARELGTRPSDLHAHNRLDVGVSGTVVFSRDPETRSELRSFRRRYLGILADAPSPREGAFTSSIGRGSRGSRRIGGTDPKHACTRYSVIAQAPAVAGPSAQALSKPALVAFELDTGRTHQIRVHTAAARVPVVGDRRYGGPRRFVSAEGSVWEIPRLALHAARVEIETQAMGTLVGVAPVPSELEGLWALFGGDSAMWAQALAAPVPAWD